MWLGVLIKAIIESESHIIRTVFSKDQLWGPAFHPSLTYVTFSKT